MIPIRILRFFEKYVAAPDGTLKTIDMVEYCAVGSENRAHTIATVQSLSRVSTDPDQEGNPAVMLARQRWDIINKHYIAWKENREVPNEGTPIAAWAGVTSEQADVIRAAGLRSVEELAAAGDTVIARIRLPGATNLRKQAQAFVDAKDQSVVAARINETERQLAEKNDEIAEMRAMIEELMRERADNGDDDLEPDGSAAPPRRRGRPPKVQAEAA